MRPLLLLSLGVLALTVAGCGRGPQGLASPCVGQVDGGSCPACASSSECVVVGNPCHATAACVPRAGNWATTMEGCAFEYAPPTDPCVCFENVCQQQPTR